MAASDFHFQKFSVRHAKSAMKVGIDSMLLGGWAPFKNPKTILDIGTGCGLLSLMMAQRFPGVEIMGVEMDPVACEETEGNFTRSPWSDRLKTIQGNALDLSGKFPGRFDAIISNPPFFTESLRSQDQRKNTARHQESLSTTTLLQLADKLLNSCGTMALILPHDHLAHIRADLESVDLFIDHLVHVRPLITRTPHRIMLYLSRVSARTIEDELVIGPPHQRSEDFLRITNPFYQSTKVKKRPPVNTDDL